MKLKTITVAVAILAWLTACEHISAPSSPVVVWSTSDGQPVATIVKQPGMEITFLTPQQTVGVISVPVEGPDSIGTIELDRIPFLINLPNLEDILYNGPNAVPCSACDDCVPPPPPLLLNCN